MSISREYTPLSRHIIIEFLKENRFDSRYAKMVKPRNPPRKGRLEGIQKNVVESCLDDVEDVSALVSEIEADNKGLPVLLRHYLKLNGVLLSFNVDEDFAQVLDGLILVDLEQTDKRLLSRFMGDAGHRSFLAHGKALEQ